MAGPPDPADAAKEKEAAAARRRKRASLAEEGEDEMPSMEDLGLGLPGTTILANFPVQWVQLSARHTASN